MTLDHAGFDAEMAAQKERARNAAATEATDRVVVRAKASPSLWATTPLRLPPRYSATAR